MASSRTSLSFQGPVYREGAPANQATRLGGLKARASQKTIPRPEITLKNPMPDFFPQRIKLYCQNYAGISGHYTLLQGKKTRNPPQAAVYSLDLIT